MSDQSIEDLRKLAQARMKAVLLPAKLTDVNAIVGDHKHAGTKCTVCNAHIPRPEFAYLVTFSGNAMSETHAHLHFRCHIAWSLEAIVHVA